MPKKTVTARTTVRSDRPECQCGARIDARSQGPLCRRCQRHADNTDDRATDDRAMERMVVQSLCEQLGLGTQPADDHEAIECACSQYWQYPR